MYPQKFEALIESLKRLPGVGAKTAERYAFHILDWNEEDKQNLIQSLVDIKEGLKDVKYVGILLMKIFVIYVLIQKEIKI